MTAPLPEDEAARLANLHDHSILDTSPQTDFDDIVRLAAQVCGTPIAAVSLIDEHRQWFKAITGLDVTETPRDIAFCAHTILGDDLMVIPDARSDPRFQDNALVTGDPHIRFYAGMPLVGEEGHALGSLCVIDKLPRRLTPDQQETLRLLARQAASHLKSVRRFAQQEKLIAERERLVAEREAAETEKRRADGALQAEREFTRALLESLQEGIAACDAEGTLTLFNRATREFHGLPAQPLPPDQWAEHFDLFQGDAITPMQTQDIPLFRALQGETVTGAEMVIAPRLGPARTLLATGQAIYGAGGRKLGAVVAMHDVTERRQAEQERARLAAIVESSEEAILAATLNGDIVSWNKGAEQLYGYGAAEMIGQSVFILADPDQPNPAPAVVRRLLRGETVPPMEVLSARSDGVRFHAALAFSPIRDASGTMIGLSCIARDTTARREAEAALAASHAALQESNAALQKSETRLTEAQRVARMGSWEHDLASGRIIWSHELFGLLGRNPALGEPDYESYLSLHHPEDAAALAKLVARAVAFGEDYEIDLRLADQGGPPQWRHSVGRVVRDAAGRTTRLVGTLSDITERKTMEAALRDQAERLRRSEASLRTVLESAPIILYAADAEGIVTLSEGLGLAALGLNPGEAVGRSVFEFSGGEPENEANARRALAGEALSYDAHYGNLCLHTELRPLRNSDGSSGGLSGVCFDVTERVSSEERFRVLFEQSTDAHLLCGARGIIDCNNATLTMLRCADKAQILGTHPSFLSPEFQPDGRRSEEKGRAMEVLAHKWGFQRFEWTHRRLDGEEFPTEVTLTPVTLADGPATLAILHDHTERKRAEEQIKDHAVVLEFQKGELERANAELAALATTDGLTGLKNHRAFQEKLAEEVSRSGRYGPPLCLIFLDVDHFKQYNDAFGHPQGDEVLRQVAALMKKSARETDMTARYGGEEFALLLPHTDLQSARVFAERLRAALERHAWPLRAVTASFGVATLALGDAGDLIARADAAMYQSKAAGRNRVTCASGSPAAADTLPGSPLS